MEIRFDHLVVAARVLEEGVAWVESRLGVPMGPGGRHDTMGTHNRLVSLGPGRFLEVIAIDPAAPAPERARWFALDTAATASRLERGPALIHWVARTDDIEGAIGAAAAGASEILSLSRGDFRWKIGVPPSGSLAQAGTAPTFIQWLTRHPAEVLPDAGCRLEALVLHHPTAVATLKVLRDAGLDADEPLQAATAGVGLAARIRTPRGIVELGD